MQCTYFRISHVDFKEMPDWGLCDQHCQVGLDKYVICICFHRTLICICFHRTLILHSNSKSSEADNKHGQICLTL